MTIDPEEASEFAGSDGKFFSIKRDMQPGDKMEVVLIDISKNTRTNYPIKDKDYAYRLTFKDGSGQQRLLDMNGRDAIRQALAALYPNGLDQPMSPCKATLSRRTERKTNQSELELVRTAPASDEDAPF